jgi:predicted O-methyltransferase YrrM
MKNLVKDSLGRLPYLRQLLLERDRLLVYKTWVPPGHYYSPIPSIAEIKRRQKRIFNNIASNIPGIDLNEKEQLTLLGKFKEYYKDLPFGIHKTERLRYSYVESWFSYTDAIVLYCMIRHTQPRKIIEIGSGYSSCVTLDTNELFFNNSISCIFIDPDSRRFKSLIKDSDYKTVEIIENELQEVDIAKFSELAAGDILFIDSSHVSKIDSDVNQILFRILPHLKSGVYIHFHDIFYPFEYPKEWIYGGRAWNEAYMLRAFLQYNNNFTIQFFASYIALLFEDKLIEALPLCINDPKPDSEMRNSPASSMWIKKI